jgi:hypothetical protein
MAHEVLTQLRSLRESLPPPTEQNKDIREELLVESRKLLLSLERTDNVVERICFQVNRPISQGYAWDLSDHHSLAMGDHCLSDCD